MRYEGNIYRPPSEANSYILQCTIGCLHNACTFCGMYKDKRFRIRTLEEIEQDIVMAAQFYGSVEKVFLADGDAMAIKGADLIRIAHSLNNNFSNLRHVGIYAGPRSILNKTDGELRALKEAGITIAYLGVETGDEMLLKEINKGVTRSEMIEAGQKIVKSGIKLSVTVLLGLSGKKERSLAHARSTAEVCNAINPDFLGLLTLMVDPVTTIARRVQQGSFELLAPFEIMTEMKELIARLNVDHCELRSNHASNYLAIKASLPGDKDKALSQITEVLDHRAAHELRPEFLRGL
jgi:radical SAM superfamily enzyme YgiQ (UPF0313 family)